MLRKRLRRSKNPGKKMAPVITAGEFIPMKGDELVRKILAGERDFSGIELEKGFNLNAHPAFKELQVYLQKRSFPVNPDVAAVEARNPDFYRKICPNLFENPLIFEYASIRGLIAGGLNLPSIRGRNADFSGSSFRNGDISCSDLTFSDLSKCDLENTSLRYVGAISASFEDGNLTGADVYGIDFYRANLRNTQMRNARNLEQATNLGYAIFDGTRVTPREMAAITEARGRIEMFKIED